MTARKYRAKKTIESDLRVPGRGIAVGWRLPQSKEVADMVQPTSLDVANGFADASVVGDIDATDASRSPPRQEIDDGATSGNGATRPHETDETSATTAKRASRAAKIHERKERRKLKKEKAKEGGGAHKAGHKVPTYSSDSFNDKLLRAGRGCASGGVSVDGGASQETAIEHTGCTAEVSPGPVETRDAVLVEADQTKLGKKVRSRKLVRC